MQVSQAKNETRLPRAVLKRSAAIDERLKQRTDSKPDPVEPEVATATGTTPPEESSATTPQTPPADPRENDPAYWKHLHSVTAGRLNKERADRRADQDAFNLRLTELQSQINALQAKAPTTDADIDLGQFFSPEQVQALGEDECRTMAATALKAAQATVRSALDAELKPLKDARAEEASRQVADRKTQFMDQLAELVPNYEEVDATDGWKAWLAQDDESTGVQRQELLNVHIAKLDAKKIAKFFDAYALTQKPMPTPPVTPRGSGAAPASEIPAARPTGGYPSAAEIKDYYKRASLGRVKDQERIEFEARLKLRGGR